MRLFKKTIYLYLFIVTTVTVSANGQANKSIEERRNTPTALLFSEEQKSVEKYFREFWTFSELTTITKSEFMEDWKGNNEKYNFLLVQFLNNCVSIYYVGAMDEDFKPEFPHIISYASFETAIYDTLTGMKKAVHTLNNFSTLPRKYYIVPAIEADTSIAGKTLLINEAYITPRILEKIEKVYPFPYKIVPYSVVKEEIEHPKPGNLVLDMMVAEEQNYTATAGSGGSVKYVKTGKSTNRTHLSLIDFYENKVLYNKYMKGKNGEYFFRNLKKIAKIVPFKISRGIN